MIPKKSPIMMPAIMYMYFCVYKLLIVSLIAVRR